MEKGHFIFKLNLSLRRAILSSFVGVFQHSTIQHSPFSGTRKGRLDIMQGLRLRHLPSNSTKGMNNYLSIFKFFAFVLFLCFRSFKPAKQNHNKDSYQWHLRADSIQLQSENLIFLLPFHSLEWAIHQFLKITWTTTCNCWTSISIRKWCIVFFSNVITPWLKSNLYLLRNYRPACQQEEVTVCMSSIHF